MDVGGIETNVLRLVRAMRDRGNEVVVMSRGGRLVDRLTEGGYRHDLLTCENSLRGVFSDVRSIRRSLADFRPDLIHSFSASTNLRVQIACRFSFGYRYLNVASIMGLKTRPDENVVKTYARAFCTAFGTARLIVIAPAIGEVARRLPIRRSRLVTADVVGVELIERDEGEMRRSARRELGLDASEKVVMTVGRLDPSKSPELFLEAFAQISSDATGVMIGGGALRDEVEQLVRTLGIEDRVGLPGEREDAPALLAAADVYVRPGVVEGFVGITVLEAQALAVPVIAFETEDVKLAIEHGVSGWLVPNGDARAMAEAIDLLIGDEELAASIGKAGQDSMESRFSIQNVAKGLEDIYRSVVMEDSVSRK